MNKQSKRQKRYQNPQFVRTRHSAVDFAKALLERHTQREAHKIAAHNVAGLNKTLAEGDLSSWNTGTQFRLTLEFWKSVAGFLTRYPRKLEEK